MDRPGISVKNLSVAVAKQETCRCLRLGRADRPRTRFFEVWICRMPDRPAEAGTSRKSQPGGRIMNPPLRPRDTLARIKSSLLPGQESRAKSSPWPPQHWPLLLAFTRGLQPTLCRSRSVSPGSDSAKIHRKSGRGRSLPPACDGRFEVLAAS
jgi:hypothetical protein